MLTYNINRLLEKNIINNTLKNSRAFITKEQLQVLVIRFKIISYLYFYIYMIPLTSDFSMLTKNAFKKSLSLGICRRVEADDKDWETALPTSKLPGPSLFRIIRGFTPGGEYYNGFLRQPTFVITFDPNDLETLFHTEGTYPTRNLIDTLKYYRGKYRQDIYKGNGGISVETGDTWFNMRKKLNPVMMVPKTVNSYIPKVDEIVKEFIETRIKSFLGVSNEMPSYFWREINKWALDTISMIGIDYRLGVMDESISDAMDILNAIDASLKLRNEYDVLPSIWKYYKTPNFYKLMEANDHLTEIAYKYINKTLEQVEENRNSGTAEERKNTCIIEKLLIHDRQIATIAAIEMIAGGVRTTSSLISTCLYYLAINPDKQERLRKEIVQIIPDENSLLEENSLNTIPYFRACLKESLRMRPIAIGIMRCAGKNVVLQGYRIPKMMQVFGINAHTLRDNDQYPEPDEFIPERWLSHRSEYERPTKSARAAHKFSFLPFGYGVRSCIGRRFAEMESAIFIMRLLRVYQIKWNYGPMKYRQSFIYLPDTELKFELNKI